MKNINLPFSVLRMRKHTFKSLLLLVLTFVSGNAMAQTKNLLTNGGFEDWSEDAVCTGWKSESTASNATLSQSTDAKEGVYAVWVAGSSSGNKRLATAEITLKAGTYVFSVYAKAATEDGGSFCVGYVPVTNGNVGTYVYQQGDDKKTLYHNDLRTTEWTAANYTFELSTETTICLVVMNAKTPGKAIIVDEASLTTENGGLVVGGGNGDEEVPGYIGDGSKDNPYTVADVLALNNPKTKAWVKGVIVGYVNDNTYYFTADNVSNNTNLLLAADARVTEKAFCIPVQLPAGTIRTALNLQDNPTNLGCELLIYGSLEAYFSAPGIKSPSDYVLGEGSGGEDPTPSAGKDIRINEANFPDPKFRSWLYRQSYGADSVLTSAEISGITGLYISNEISDLTGIGFFTALTYLDCRDNKLTTLDLSENTALEILYCWNNRLTTLNVSKNAALQVLNCNNNQLSTLDVSKNPALTYLCCPSNQLTTLDVSGNTALTDLICYNNQLTTLDLSKNTALIDLDVSWNEIRGAGMDALISSLPTYKSYGEHTIHLLFESFVGLGCDNTCTKTQVAAIKAKGWAPEYFANSGDWEEYEGSDEENTDGIASLKAEAAADDAPVYDLSGRKVAPRLADERMNGRKGIYVVNGRKVVLK